MENKQKIIIVAAVAIFAAIAGGGFRYWQKMSSVSVSSEPIIQTPIDQERDQETPDISLGNQILEKTQNIIKHKFPETNPLKQIVQNPF